MRRVLLARCDRLGDVVLTLPAVAAVRAAYPEAELSLLVRPPLGELARMVEGVDAVVESEARGAALLSAVRAARPDLAICVSRGAALAWAVARARVPHRVGAGLRWYSPLFRRRVAERRRGGGRHEVEYALSFAHRAGAAGGPARFALAVPAAAERGLAAWLADRGLDPGGAVLLHPGSGGSCPAWPLERWIELASALVAAGRRVLVSVGPGDAAVAAAFDAAGGAARDAPRFDGGVQQLAALARRVAAVASNSTGPLHLAAALGTPTLGFYAPWATCGAARWGPYSERGRALVAEVEGAVRWTRAARRRHGREVLAAIPAAVAARCLSALADAP